jgi:serine/threonine protein kinase
VHRDVSLSNIVVGFDGQVKLVDFGIATASVVTAKEGLIGKFSYMSPEQIAKQPLDGRSDIFSLGIVLYELIAGRPLFRRETDAQTTKAVCEDAIPSLAEHGVPKNVEEVILKALERSRERRYASARELELALQATLQQRGSLVTAHQLSLYMKQLFGDESIVPPMAPSGSFPVHPGAGQGSSESYSYSRSHSYQVKKAPWEKDGEEETAVNQGPASLAVKPRPAEITGAAGEVGAGAGAAAMAPSSDQVAKKAAVAASPQALKGPTPPASPTAQTSTTSKPLLWVIAAVLIALAAVWVLFSQRS